MFFVRKSTYRQLESCYEKAQQIIDQKNGEIDKLNRQFAGEEFSFRTVPMEKYTEKHNEVFELRNVLEKLKAENLAMSEKLRVKLRRLFVEKDGTTDTYLATQYRPVAGAHMTFDIISRDKVVATVTGVTTIAFEMTEGEERGRM